MYMYRHVIKELLIVMLYVHACIYMYSQRKTTVVIIACKCPCAFLSGQLIGLYSENVNYIILKYQLVFILIGHIYTCTSYKLMTQHELLMTFNQQHVDMTP